MSYINRKGVSGSVETIEDLKGLDKKEKRRLLQEYRLSDKYGVYYFSQRATKEWRAQESKCE